MLKKILLGFAGLVLLLVLGIQFVDWNKYKQPILDQVHQSTGYDVKIAGSIGVSIFPLPALTVENVTVHNPAGFTKDPLLTLEKLSLRLQLLPLLTGKVAIHTISLIKPVIRLEMKSDGRANYDMAQKQSEAEKKSVSVKDTKNDFDLSIKKIIISKGYLSFSDEKKKQKHELKSIEINAAIESLMGPISGDVELGYDDFVFSGSIDCGVIQDKFPHYIKLKTKVLKEGKDYGVLTLNGRKSGGQFQGDLSSQGVKIPFQVKLGEKVLNLQKGITLTANLLGDEKRIHVSNIHLKFDDVLAKGDVRYDTSAQSQAKFQLNIGGSQIFVDALAQAEAPYNTQISVQGANLDGFYQWAKLQDLQKQLGSSVRLDAQGTYAQSVLNLKMLSLKTSRYEGKGTLRVETQGTVPVVSLDFHLPILTIPANDTKSSGDSRQPSGKSSYADPIKAERWSKNPWDLSGLAAINCNANIIIDKVQYQKYVLSNVTLKAQLQNGNINNAVLQSQVYGGHMNTRMKLIAAKQDFTLETQGQGIALHQVPDLKGTPLKQGVLSYSGSVKGQASSMYDLIHSLGGSLTVALVGGIVETFDVKGFVTDLKQAKDVSALGRLKSHFDKKTNVYFHSLKGSFNIQKGQATTNNLELLSDDMNMKADGFLNLPGWSMNLNARVRFPELPQVPALGVYVRGAIDAPSYGVDQEQLIKIIVQGVASALLNQVQKNVKGPLGDILGAIIPGNKNKDNNSQKQPSQEPSGNQKRGGNVVEDFIGGLFR